MRFTWVFFFFFFLFFNWQIEKAAAAGLDPGRDRTELAGKKAPRHPGTSPSFPPVLFVGLPGLQGKKIKAAV